ncbi:MAG: glycosyltransferase [Brasilonema angustatum HA4187-MV1]|jgi:glycosyltransferase involved in cell wall biosynthesis|nr:glycosyltransferase [Brasilonema angustatum HA4187-MV1]
MDVIISTDQRYDGTPDGAVWSPTNGAYPFWLRYLEVFDNVRVMARVRPVSSVPSNWQRVDGERISVVPIPYYIGPVQYLLKALQVQQAVSKGANLNDAIILRVPSNVANCIEYWLRHTGHPYGLEVVADSYNFFAPGSVKHPLRPFFRRWFTNRLQKQCAQASAVSFVTKEALQRRYPPGEKTYSTFYSDVELSNEAFVSSPRLPHPDSDKFTLITVASMDHSSKAIDVLIDAVAICVKQKLNLELILVGDGKYRGELEAQTAKLGIKERVFFRGKLPAGKAVFEQLDKADVFVLASRQEGLPRAIIEAMTRGLPCIGSNVGGIPELLTAEDLVQPGDAVVLAAKIQEVITVPERMIHMSTRNLEAAKQYKDDFLRERRLEFYHYVKQTTEAWLKINN